MPTFENIGIHPRLRSRLVTQATTTASTTNRSSTSAPIVPPAPGRRASDLNNRSDSIPSTTDTNHNRDITFQPVATPLALLLRHPDSLRLYDPETKTCQKIQESQIQQLRQEVAEALISHTPEGLRTQFLRDVIGTVSAITTTTSDRRNQCNRKRKLRTSDRHREWHQHNENSHSNKPDNGEGEVDENDAVPTATSTTGRPATNQGPNNTEFPGTVNLIDLLRFENLAFSTSPSPLHDQTTDVPPRRMPIPTGCRALDAMLGTPPEYAQTSTDLEQQLVSTNVDSANNVGGIAFGYVTQFFGPPASGKTQLAIHLAVTCCKNSRQGRCWLLCRPALVLPCSQQLAQLTRLDDPAALDQIRVLPVSSSYDVMLVLSQLEAILLQDLMNARDQTQTAETVSNRESTTSEHSSFHTSALRPTLLVLDSASTCLSSLEGDAEQMQQVAITLKRLARHYQVAVVITNGINKRNPALGLRWNQSASDVLVRFEALVGCYNSQGQVLYQATLVQHPAKAFAPNSIVANYVINRICGGMLIRDCQLKSR